MSSIEASHRRAISLTSFVPLACVCIAAFFFASGVQWIQDHRIDGLVDIDEASYLGIAIGNYLALSKEGVLAWLISVAGSIQAPLTTMTASLLFATTGLELHYGFWVPLAFATLTIVATYMLVAEISGPYAGLSAAALTASVPLIINYSRHFHFAMPATAVLLLALLAAVKSDRFSRTGWSIAFGIFLGLLPLARTMAIAFIPGLLFGAALSILSSPGIPNRLIRFGAALGIAALTAATWLAFTWEGVFGYLVGWGYGPRASEYGPVIPFFAVDSLRRAILLLTHALYLPHFGFIVVGLAAGLVVACRAVYRHGWKAVRHGANSPVFLLATTVFCGLAALVSSPNTGTAFVAPLLPPLIAMAVSLAWAALEGLVYRTVVLCVTVGIAIMVALPFLGIYVLLPREKTMGLTFIGPIAISSNRAVIDFYIAGSSPHPIGLDKPGAALWQQLFARTNSAISRQREGASVAVGFKHGLYSPGALAFDHLVKTLNRREFIPPDPVASGNTGQGYREWLTKGAAAHALLVLTSAGTEGEYAPMVDLAAVEEAARSLRFQAVDTWTMPNGRPVTLWKRPENIR